MSKAFTRESEQSESVALPARAPLPPGVKNYITPAGAQRLREALERLAGTSSASDPLREARIQQLREVIASLVIAESPADRETVRFGATVVIQRGRDTETYRLVGVDEIDLDRNEISWLSPLGKVLLGRRAGEKVRFRSPAGFEEIKILSLHY